MGQKCGVAFSKLKIEYKKYSDMWYSRVILVDIVILLD